MAQNDSLPASKLTKNQKRHWRVEFEEDGRPYVLVAKVRHDDECGNGHNTFSVTATLYGPDRIPGERTTKNAAGRTLWMCGGGCMHDDVARRIPELAPFIKWHMVGTDGPMHYVANTRYHADNGDLAAARVCAVWPDATDEELTAPGLEDRLMARLPALMAEFKAAVESLGFVY